MSTSYLVRLFIHINFFRMIIRSKQTFAYLDIRYFDLIFFFWWGMGKGGGEGGQVMGLVLILKVQFFLCYITKN